MATQGKIQGRLYGVWYEMAAKKPTKNITLAKSAIESNAETLTEHTRRAGSTACGRA